MTRIRKLTVGSLLGATLSLGLGGIAAAESPPAVTANSTPATSAPAPSTSTPSTTPSSPSTPSTTAPSSAAAPRRLLTGNEIWRIVQPHRPISCAHAAKELTRIRKADTAAAKRVGHWQAKQMKQAKHTTSAAAQTKTSHKAATAMKKSSGRLRGFQKLQSEGQALIKRIEAKCPAAAAA